MPVGAWSGVSHKVYASLAAAGGTCGVAVASVMEGGQSAFVVACVGACGMVFGRFLTSRANVMQAETQRYQAESETRASEAKTAYDRIERQHDLHIERLTEAHSEQVAAHREQIKSLREHIQEQIATISLLRDRANRAERLQWIIREVKHNALQELQYLQNELQDKEATLLARGIPFTPSRKPSYKEIFKDEDERAQAILASSLDAAAVVSGPG